MIRELAPEETGLAYEAMTERRGHITDEGEFAERVNELQRPEGYRLAAAFDEGDEMAAAVAGFREGHNLAWGHFIYIDDLSTRPRSRRRGHGAALLQWVLEEAGRLGCDQVHLDSGVGLERSDAHRLYHNSGYVIQAHHFARGVEPG